MKVTDLTPDNKNANKGTTRGNKAIAASLKELGAGRSILIDADGRVIAGNKTLAGAIAAGIQDVQVVQSDGSSIIAVQRTDISLDSEAGRKLAIADNRTAQLNLDWDADALAQLSEEFDLSGYFTDSELRNIIPPEVDEDEDDVPDAPDEPITKPGDLIILGTHRLLCGDATSATDVDRLLDGNVPHLMVTDPPYGVDYDPTWRDGKGGFSTAPVLQRGVVANDDRDDWREAWALFPGDAAYVWCASMHNDVVIQSLEAADFIRRSHIIWIKQQGVFSRADYHWQHEPCWYVVKKGRTGHWAGDRKQTTVWEIQTLNPTGNRDEERVGHGTQKPVECMRRPILNNSKRGDGVYDPFLGSGTTLIACESEGRVCYGMEIDPAYCDVIVARWEKQTKKKAERPKESQ
jgi:DNA modification methylase